jgi:PiT family inorganic phosphate transporter
MTIVVFILLIGLAAANGSNDVCKGVATLAGAGVTRYRTAILWGAATTFAGCLFSLNFADKMTKLFSKGIVAARPTPAFTVAVLLGAAAWVAFSTAFRLPVSTTHAIIGALIGAGLLVAPGAVNWHALPTRIVVPLLLSVVVAFAISAILNLIPTREPQCTCQPARVPVMAGGGGESTDSAAAVNPSCPVHGTAVGAGQRTMTVAHWLSSGAASFARGLNDAPKLVAIGAFALIPAGMTATQVLLVVAVAMLLGSVFGLRLAHRLGEGVVKMGHAEGFKANLTTAVLVGFGAGRGWPMSTTHVSTGAIAGTAGKDIHRINQKTIRDFVIAWVVTPPFAAVVAALAYLALR